MPIRSRIFAPLGLVVSQAYGQMTLADLRANRSFVVNHPHYRQALALLFDLRRVTDVAMTSNEIRDHAQFGDSGEARYRRIAILVDGDLTFGLARIFQAYARRYDEHTLALFRDSGQAWRWVRGRLPG